MTIQTQLSVYFEWSEFACKGDNCCDRTSAVHPELIKKLNALRSFLDHPIIVVSGFRCNKHNTKIEGALHSYHTAGMAADIKPLSMDIKTFAGYCDIFFKDGGLGIYKNWIHVDVREGGPKRWSA